MSVDLLQVYIGIAGLGLAAIGLPLLFVQLRDVKRSIQSGAHAEITPEHEDFDRVVTISELFLNHLEHIAVLGDSFGRHNRPALDRFCKVSLERSPILRQHLAQNPMSYSDSLRRFLPPGSR